MTPKAEKELNKTSTIVKNISIKLSTKCLNIN